MNRVRLAKFKRMLRYQLNRVEMIRQRVAIQRNEIQILQQQLAVLTSQMELAQETSISNATSVATVQLCDLQMVEIQRDMNARKAEIAGAEEKLDHLLNTYRDEERQLKAWEKLTFRETSKLETARLMFEQRQADELYLLTKFSGETR